MVQIFEAVVHIAAVRNQGEGARESPNCLANGVDFASLGCLERTGNGTAHGPDWGAETPAASETSRGGVSSSVGAN